MEEYNIINTIDKGERVTSIYADTYYNETTGKKKVTIKKITEKPETKVAAIEEEWKSPSDLLIGVIDLTPPFTSKITRGKTHEGILAIGNAVLEAEQYRFSQYLSKLINENEIAWNRTLEHEKAAVVEKVKKIYQNILATKSKILMTEVNQFYESTLQELESHLRQEVGTVLDSAHANIISDLNVQIEENLKKERMILEDVLKRRYDSEVTKIKHYYILLLDNEQYRSNQLVHKSLQDKNDTLNGLYRQIYAENITSTMYVMSTERKKCRIKQFLLNTLLNSEVAAKRQQIQERKEILDAYKANEKDLKVINKDWQDKIRKILRLFLKFVSFSLKLLPEQTTFILDLEKMVVLQLSEMIKNPRTTSILIDEKEYNYFGFEKVDPLKPNCKKPFVIVGDTSDPIPPRHASRETLASDVDLPYIKMNWHGIPPKQLIYAKCGRLDEVKALLEAKRCKCRDGPPKASSTSIISDEKMPISESSTVTMSESSKEPLLMDNIEIYRDCPAKRCEDWRRRLTFPYLNNYLDYNEEKYEKVRTILGKPPPHDITLREINPRDMITQEFPFSATGEKFHNIGTQYSSQGDILQDLTDDISDLFTCPCTEKASAKIQVQDQESISRDMNKIMMKRKASLQRLIHDHPNLLILFTDESFDFIYNIK